MTVAELRKELEKYKGFEEVHIESFTIIDDGRQHVSCYNPVESLELISPGDTIINGIEQAHQILVIV